MASGVKSSGFGSGLKNANGTPYYDAAQDWDSNGLLNNRDTLTGDRWAKWGQGLQGVGSSLGNLAGGQQGASLQSLPDAPLGAAPEILQAMAGKDLQSEILLTQLLLDERGRRLLGLR